MNKIRSSLANAAIRRAITEAAKEARREPKADG
jgi:hypothetical protein